MNKLTKIGVSALCGSLAAVSAAHAGELTVSGSVDTSWISLPNAETGNPFGMGSNISFAGSGELDNGWAVAFALDNTNAQAFSNARVVVGIPGLGDVRYDMGLSGTGIDRMDDNTPTAWEEAYGAGLGSGIDTVAGASGGAGIEITPSALMPDGIVTRLHWSPNADGSNAGDKAGSGVSGPLKSGFDITIEASGDATPDGLTLYGGISRIDQFTASTAINDDVEEWTAGIKYAVGGFTLGYQYSDEDNGRATTKSGYVNEGYGIVFAINDDLSVSYNNYQSEQQGTQAQTTVEASSIQVAYSAGGLSVRVADQTVDNKVYATGAANQRDATTLSVALAF